MALDLSGEVSDSDGPFSSVLLVPVQHDPAFVLALFRRGGAFTADEIQRHSSLAALLGELHDESRARLRAASELERMEERLRTIDDLRPAFAGAQDPITLAEAAARAIAQRFHAEATSVMLLQPNGELRVVGSVGLPIEIARDARRRVGEGIAGWVAERGRGVLLRGPVSDARFSGVDPDAQTALSVPLRVGDEILGVVNVKRPHAGTTFDESHLRELEAVARDVAAGLRQVEALRRLDDDRRRAIAIAEIARLAQSGDRRTAARLACEALGYAAIGVETAEGMDVLHAEPGASVQSPEVSRFPTPSGTVVFAPGTDSSADTLTIAERVAPLLAPPRSPEGAREERAPQSIRRVLRVFIVEDHPVVREGIRRVIERDGDMAVCGAAQTIGEALSSLPEARAEVVVCDLHLPDATGAEAVHRLVSGRVRPIVVVFTFDTSPDVVTAALQAGARGYIPKHASPEELRAAIRAVAAGVLAVHPDVLPAFSPASAEHTQPPEPEAEHERTTVRRDASGMPHESLTPRELEYLRYLAEGYTNKEVARAMVLAEDTVKKGVQALIAKLGAVDRTHAVVLALRADLIE